MITLRYVCVYVCIYLISKRHVCTGSQIEECVVKAEKKRGEGWREAEQQ